MQGRHLIEDLLYILILTGGLPSAWGKVGILSLNGVEDAFGKPGRAGNLKGDADPLIFDIIISTYLNCLHL